MTYSEAGPWIDEAAAEVLSAARAGGQMPPFSGRRPRFSLAEAYDVAERIRGLRGSGGETVIGRKIGFTNRAVWDAFGLCAPIWGYMYDTTVGDLTRSGARFALAGLAEPRIEPEIVLGLSESPDPGMDDVELLGCIDWVAHGFEIVNSIYPGWVFGAADGIAAFGLHAALLVGKRHRISEDRTGWGEMLPRFSIELRRDGEAVTRGHGYDVLGGPVQALRFLVLELARSPALAPLRPGEIVTTGSLTQAPPVAPGEIWTTVVEGIDLGGLRLKFE